MTILKKATDFILSLYATITLRTIAAIIFCVTTIILFSGLTHGSDRYISTIIGYASSALLLFARTRP